MFFDITSAKHRQQAGRFNIPRIMGRYLVIAGFSELAVLGSVSWQLLSFPYYLMPRVGWWDWLRELNLPGTFHIWFPEVLSGSWLVLLGVLLLLGKRPIKTYIVSELFLAIPTLRFEAALLISGGGHVLVRSDGFAMLFESFVFTFVPILLAIRALQNRSAK